MLNNKHIYIHKGNENKVKEVEKNEVSFSAWLNSKLSEYKATKNNA
ncbi:MAG: hypothetical protein GY861_13785 [bacterium]|nr:hypothetical protein [bacterium]